MYRPHDRWRPRIVPVETPVIVERETIVKTTGSTPVRTPRRVCLTKEYLPTGAVMFRDVCTNEWAQNPPPEEQPPAKPQADLQNGK